MWKVSIDFKDWYDVFYGFLIDLGVISSVRSFQTTCIMNQQGIPPYHTNYMDNHSIRNGHQLIVDHQLRLLQLLSETKDREQRVVDYASTLPTTFI